MWTKLLCIGFIAAISGSVVMDELCPKLKAVDNFNLTAFHNGRWYEMARINNEIEKRGDCVYIDHNFEDGSYKLTLTEVIDGKKQSVSGYVKIDSIAGNTGILDYIAPIITESEGLSMLTVYILDVDYDNYAVMYGCSILDGVPKKRHEFAWILSRTNSLENKSKLAIENYLKTNQVFSNEKLFWDHKTCKIGV